MAEKRAARKEANQKSSKNKSDSEINLNVCIIFYKFNLVGLFLTMGSYLVRTNNDMKDKATTRRDYSKLRTRGKHKRSNSVEERHEDLHGDDAEYEVEGSPRSRSKSKMPRPTKSYNKMEGLKLKMKSTGDESGKDTSQPSSNKHKRPISAADDDSKGAQKRVSSHTQSILSVPSQSAIKQKDSKRVKTSSSVRFDQSASRPKLDIFSSGVHKRDEKKMGSKSSNQTTSKPTSTQSSGISSCEGLGGRRRKKLQGKSKSKSIGLSCLDDDGAFL